MLAEDQMYQALIEKDSSYEGIFVVAVKTTGVFCRPTCSARKPLRKNVEFYKTGKEALLHGYRPCRVCTPMQQKGETPDFINGLLKEIAEEPSRKIKDWDMRQLGIEPSKVRRWFLKNHGITFQAYQRMLRINAAFKQLQNGEAVSAAAYDNGYESVSGFNDSFKSLTGVSPTASKTKSIIDMTRLETPLGVMVACAVEQGICLLEFADRRMLETELKQLKELLKAPVMQGRNNHFEVLRTQLAEYFAGTRQQFTVPLVTPGTAFQQAVWKELQTIPFGTTRSYQQQADALGNPRALRAVAGANGMNRIAIVVPCHRVIGSNGKLVGYGGGLWRKQWLLEHETAGAGRA